MVTNTAVKFSETTLFPVYVSKTDCVSFAYQADMIKRKWFVTGNDALH